jgi:dipeptidyl-peptidase-4
MTQLTLARIFSDPDLNGATPLALKFSPDGRSVSYLQAGVDDFERLDLWAFDIQSQRSRLLVEAASLENKTRLLSDEEKARRERKRISQSGIVEYCWSPDASAILFPLDGNLFLYHLQQDTPLQQLTTDATFETDLRFSPDGHYLTFVREQNLFCIELSTGAERQLTYDGGGTVSNGLAEFIAQEEMHRFDGYWWSPDSQYIIFTQVDEASVELSQRYEIDADQFGVFDQRYPFAGKPNALVRLGLVGPASTFLKARSANEVEWLPLLRESDSYIARVNWLADSNHIAIAVQSRDQQHLDLVIWDKTANSFNTVLTETSATWINLHDNFHALKTLPQFIWASERSGYLHLYVYDLSGQLLSTLTQGPWIVGRIQGVDEQRGLVYFDGFADTPLERHLYQVSLQQPQTPVRITQAGQSHHVEMNTELDYFIDRFSSPSQPPAVHLNAINGHLINTLQANQIDVEHPYHTYIDHQGDVEFGELAAADGQTLHYRLIKPPHLSAGEKCPLILTVYGGPGVQRVSREWIPAWHHYMASRGYALLQLDNRGTANRGKAFEAPIYGKFGEIEVADQLLGIKHVCTLPWIDAARVGVFGHSYGGYMTLMLMMQAPDVFIAGISVAPVTDWRLYDTHYTERYLGHPEHNRAGYQASSVFPYVAGLKGKLLVIHGMADDNVLFTNSTKLYKVLQDANIGFDIMNYPGAKHGLSGRKVNLHRYGMMDEFFDQHLTAATSSQTNQ